MERYTSLYFLNISFDVLVDKVSLKFVGCIICIRATRPIERDVNKTAIDRDVNKTGKIYFVRTL